MRIALLTSAGLVNGVAVHCHALTKFLIARGHDVLLVHRPGAWIANQVGIGAAEKMETSFARRPRELIRVARRILAFRPDVIHTHMSSAHSYGAAARLFSTLPVVATAHVWHFQFHWPLNHIVIATSPETASYNRRYNLVPARKLRIIPNFIDTDCVKPPDGIDRQIARAQLGLSHDAFIVGSIAHLSHYKRPTDLVLAFSKLAGIRPEARLVLIGAELDAAQETRQLIAQLGLADRVLLAGVRGDVPSILAAMDVFALASSRETAPLAILEAMASTLPVVATRVGLVSELVREGQSGHLVEVGDTAEMAQRLIALAAAPELRAAFGLAGRARVTREYSVHNVALRIEAVLDEATRIQSHPPFGLLMRLLVR
jgi:L-malate glycosyltransferase